MVGRGTDNAGPPSREVRVKAGLRQSLARPAPTARGRGAGGHSAGLARRVVARVPVVPAVLVAVLVGRLGRRLGGGLRPGGPCSGAGRLRAGRAALRGVRLGAGPRARRSASSSAARSTVRVSTSSPLRSEALVSPSVTYGPNRPSLITIGLPPAGSAPTSRSGGAAAAERPRVLGCAYSASASSRVTSNSASSPASDRESVPFFRYGPYRPFCAVISLAVGRVDADHPRQRQQPQRGGQVDGVQRHRLEQRRGARLGAAAFDVLVFFAGPSDPLTAAGSGRISVTYGPYRPSRATMTWPVSGSTPSSFSPASSDWLNSSSATSAVDLVGGQVLGQVGPLQAGRLAVLAGARSPLQVRPVAADPHQHLAALGVGQQRQRVDLARVDVLQPVADQLLQPAGAADRALGADVAAEVERGQPVGPADPAVGDAVELVLHRGGEVVVDQPGEVLFQQADHRERDPGRDQRLPLLPHVPAVDDRADDRGVGGGPADAQVLQRADQRRLGVPGRRGGRRGWPGSARGCPAADPAPASAAAARRRPPHRRPPRPPSPRRRAGTRGT